MDVGRPHVSHISLTEGDSTTTLGTLESDSATSWTSMPATATWGTQAGAANLVSAQATGISSTVPAFADGTFGITVATVSGSIGVTFRAADAQNFWSLRATPASNYWRLYKVVAGVTTMVQATAAGTCCTPGQQIFVQASGSTIKVIQNGATLITVTDGALSANTRAGVYASSTGNGTIDSFVAYKTTGGVSRASYDGDGKALSTTDALGNTTTNDYDALGRLAVVHRPGGTTLQYGYDALGNRTSYTDGNANQTTWQYNDPAFPSSPTQMDPPLLSPTNSSYDRAGRLQQTTDPAGPTATYGYDNANRLTSIDYADSATPDVTAVGYDNDGRRTSITETGSVGTSTWSYDSLGRALSSRLGGTGATISYGYDLAGNQTKITYPGETNPVQRCFDEVNRLTKITDWTIAGTCASTGAGVTTWGYDYDSNITSVAYPNGVTETRNYDNADRNTLMKTVKGATTLGSFTYTRDAAGQLASTTTCGANLTPAGTESYGYNPLNQLASTSGATGRTYTYDNGDNPTRLDSSFAASNAANQVCWTSATSSANPCGTPPSGATVYGYDSLGNRTTVGSGTTYGYDQLNRLTTAVVGATTSNYSYMADNLRLSKTVGSATTNFTYSNSGGIPLLLQTATPSVTSYLYGPDGVTYERKSGSTIKYTYHDQIGSIRVISDSAGSQAGTFSYDAYGNTTARTGIDSNFRYAGEYQDIQATGDTGLYYLRNRYYDPATGQFLNRDLLVGMTGQPYAYANNNPLNFMDPSGLAPWDWVADKADDAWDATGGKAVSYVNDHKVGVLKVTSVGLGVGAIVAAPFTGGTSLAALPAVLSVGSVGTAVAAEALGSKPGRAQRVTFTIGVGMLGGAVSGAFSEGGLAGWGLLTDLGMLGAGFLPVGRSSYMARVRC